MEIGERKFSDLNDSAFGLVVLGAGEPLSDWVGGIEKMLKEEQIVAANPATFSQAFTLSDNLKGKNGRTDLVLIFNKESNPNIGKLAMWRLKFGSCSWIDDFKNNYKNDYTSGGD